MTKQNMITVQPISNLKTIIEMPSKLKCEIIVPKNHLLYDVLSENCKIEIKGDVFEITNQNGHKFLYENGANAKYSSGIQKVLHFCRTPMSVSSSNFCISAINLTNNITRGMTLSCGMIICIAGVCAKEILPVDKRAKLSKVVPVEIDFSKTNYELKSQFQNLIGDEEKRIAINEIMPPIEKERNCNSKVKDAFRHMPLPLKTSSLNSR